MYIIYIYITCVVWSFWKGGNFVGRGLELNYGLEVKGPNKVFHLMNKENIKRTKEGVTPSLDSVKLCASKY